MRADRPNSNPSLKPLVNESPAVPAAKDEAWRSEAGRRPAVRLGVCQVLAEEGDEFVGEDGVDFGGGARADAGEAREAGRTVIGGARILQETGGYYMAPAIFTNTTNDMAINLEEMFGPITCIQTSGSYAEALSLANATPFGLTAGIMTRSLARANHFRANARAGCVMVNLPTAGTDYHVPFGGRGDSSYGPREQGQYAKEFYTSVKTAYIKSGEPA